MFVVGLFLLLACLSRCALASSLRCYCKSQNAIHATCDKLTPCGMPSSTGFVQCCSNGDTCGADGFCHFTQPLNGSSGYYLGGCTDPTFRDSSCPQQCTNFLTQDVIYSEATNLWTCCYNPALGLDCSNPTTETFLAPNPEKLFATTYSLQTVTSTPTQSSTRSTSTTHHLILSSPASFFTTALPTPSATSSGLTAKQQGLIGLGVSLAAAIVIGIILVSIVRRRAHNRGMTPGTPTEPYSIPLAAQRKVYWNGYDVSSEHQSFDRQPSTQQDNSTEMFDLPRRPTELPSYDTSQAIHTRNELES